jgi:hypothetical protein
MIKQANKLPDFSRFPAYRAGEYIPLASVNLTLKGIINEVHGIAEA